MAHLPASCLVVNPSAAAEVVTESERPKRESSLKEGTSILARLRAGARDAKGACPWTALNEVPLARTVASSIVLPVL